MNPNTSCEILLNNLRKSNLTFMLQETPYSMYLTIRKKFTKKTVESSLAGNHLFSKAEATKEHDNLKAELEKSKMKSKKIEETNQILENKIKGAEVEFDTITDKLKKALDEKQGEIKVLKEVIKNSNSEKSNIRDELNQSKKVIKKKDKDIYSLERKVENINENVKSLKDNNYGLKNEKSKLEKAIKNMEKKSLRATKNLFETQNAGNNNNAPDYLATATSSNENAFESSPTTAASSPTVINTPTSKSSTLEDGTCFLLPISRSALTTSDPNNPTSTINKPSSTKPPSTKLEKHASSASKADIDKIMEEVNNNEKISKQEKSFLEAFRNILYGD